MRVYISGGPNRRRFSVGTQHDIEARLHKLNPEIEIVKSGKSDFIVIDDDASEEGASETALKTGGKVIEYSDFVHLLKRQNKTEKKTNKKLRGHVAAAAATSDLEISFQGLSVHNNNLIIAFTRLYSLYFAYVYLYATHYRDEDHDIANMYSTRAFKLLCEIAALEDYEDKKLLRDYWRASTGVIQAYLKDSNMTKTSRELLIVSNELCAALNANRPIKRREAFLRSCVIFMQNTGESLATESLEADPLADISAELELFVECLFD